MKTLEYKQAKHIIDIIKYPIITDKTTKLIEENQYCFAVNYKASKQEIKQAVEYIFNVKVIKVNTLTIKNKTKKTGKFLGYKTKYKKAIVKLSEQDNINLFPEN